MPELRDPMPKQRKKPTDGAESVTSTPKAPAPPSAAPWTARSSEPSTAPTPTRRGRSPTTTPSALEADPDNVDDGIAGTNEQVIAVLVERAPELLARIERVKASTVNAAVVAAARGEEPLPGIERVKARGSLVRPDRNAGQAVEPRPRERSAAA